MNDKELNQIQEMRLLHLVEPFLIPFLQRKHEELLIKLHTKFISKESDFLAEVAQLSLIKEMIQDFESIKVRGGRATKKLDESKPEESL